MSFTVPSSFFTFTTPSKLPTSDPAGPRTGLLASSRLSVLDPASVSLALAGSASRIP